MFSSFFTACQLSIEVMRVVPHPLKRSAITLNGCDAACVTGHPRSGAFR